jgi:hypothetical protein
LPAVEGESTASQPVNGAGVTGRLDPEADGPLDGFAHDIDVTRFDSRFGRFVPLVLAGLVAIVAANAGLSAAIVTGWGIAVGLGVVVALVERDRWRAQDVLHWYQVGRLRRWLRETGSPGPGGDPAAAEIWLGTHLPGTVPQVYRASAAFSTRDAVVIKRELGAMPDLTPGDRAAKEWIVQANRLIETGAADTTELARLVGSLPPSGDRSQLESWLAIAEAALRRSAGDRDWIRTLADQRSRATRTALGVGRRTRIWISRFVVLIVFAISAFLFSSLSLAIAERGDPIPPEYAKTTFAIRGDLPGFDSERVTRALPALARALSGAVRSSAAPLSDDSFDRILNLGTPTFIWTTGAIDVPGPADASGRHVWEIEVLLGGFGQTASSAVVTFDRADGQRFLYRVDPAIVARLRQAVGLPVSATPP